MPITAEDLIAFEDDIAQEFEAGNIRAPIHLYSNNEYQIMHIFTKIDKEKDWVLCSWRSHYQCLLKGVPPAEVKAEIMAGRSISLCFPEHKVLSSAIVGGQIPIAVGLAMAEKRKGSDVTIWCFMGDMTASTGIFAEALKYSRNHDLPIKWVIEDNNKSVCTNTREAWGGAIFPDDVFGLDVFWYEYENKYPHAGMGKRIEF